MKKLSFFLIGFLSLVAQFGFAQIECEPIDMSIQGDGSIFAGEEKTYAIDSVMTGMKLRFTLFQDGNTLLRTDENSITYKFLTGGAYELRALGTIRSCAYDTQLSLRVYDSSVAVIGNRIIQNSNEIQENLKSRNLYVGWIDQMKLETSKVGEILKRADAIFVTSTQYSSFFEQIEQLQRDEIFKIKDKKIILVTSLERTLLKKIIAGFLKQYKLSNVYIVSQKEYSDLLFGLSVGQDRLNKDSMNQYKITFDNVSSRYNLSFFVDYVVYSGFPLETLKLLLILGFCSVILAFMRQVIGVNTFGTFLPLLSAYGIVTIGLSVSFYLIFVGIVITLLCKQIFKRVTLLQSAKTAIIIIGYLISTIIVLGGLRSIGYIPDFQYFSSPEFLVVYLVILMVINKVFLDKGSIKTFKFWKDTTEFIVVTFLLALIVSSDRLQNLILIYPWILLLCLLVITLIGRYTGLQLFEVIRFRKLIKKHYFKTKKK